MKLNMVRQVNCQVPGCTTGGINPLAVFKAGPYMTDPDCETVAERAADLSSHVEMVHNHARKEKEAEARKVEADTKKLTAEADKTRAEAELTRASGNNPSGAGEAVSQKGERKALTGVSSWQSGSVMPLPLSCLTTLWQQCATCGLVVRRGFVKPSIMMGQPVKLTQSYSL